MECAFEHRYDFVIWVVSVYERIKASNYKDKYELKTDDETLKHIMKNIIRNKGTFKP